MQPTVYSYLRFSTPDQLKGDSLRRQLERSQEWCKDHGLILDESLTMRDLGLSAYHGLHKAKGALGSFLKAVEAGTIQPGSILIVESLDRLSRQDVVDALTQFLSIINADIEVVTLMDGYRYSRESVKNDWTQLIISLTIMSRAHEESQAKADRLNEVWTKKRKELGERKLTATAPAWLKLNKKLQTFEPIKERVETVQRIFNEHLDGHGAYVITVGLNNDSVPTFGKAKAWGVSSVKKILHNRSVLGEFQPHSREIVHGKRRRVPEGQPVSDYYPRIINDDVFNAVQARMSSKVGKGGRTGLVGNLFQHKVFCGDCGSKFGFTKKHGGKYQYLRCGNRQAGRGCDSTPWPYRDFESAWLQECRELDVAAVLSNGNGRAAKIEAARLAVDAAKGKLADLEKRIANMEKTIEMAESEAVISMFIPKLEKALAEKTDSEKRLSDAVLSLHAATSETQSTDKQLKSLKALIHTLEKTEGADLVPLRDKLRNAIAQLVERIDLFPDGLQDRILTGEYSDHRMASVMDEIVHWQNVGADGTEHMKAVFKKAKEYKKANTGKANRAFVVHFKAGGYRLVKREGNRYINTVSTMESLLSYTSEKAD